MLEQTLVCIDKIYKNSLLEKHWVCEQTYELLSTFLLVVFLISLCPGILRKNCYRLTLLLLCAICEISLSFSCACISPFIYRCWFADCIHMVTWQQGQSPRTLALELIMQSAVLDSFVLLPKAGHALNNLCGDAPSPI